jgi:YebC/PmpR family DNA-binding regulatory protein
MAGHSKFKNIQHRKGAQDQKRAKIFTKLVREIITAVRSGAPDPAINSKLRHAIAAARGANLPRDRIDKAIKQASGAQDQDQYFEMRYEGFANAGVALIVESLTDNKNRTASDVRSAFTKFGGNLGETGSVSFMFEHLGIISYDLSNLDSEKMLQIALDIGVLDVVSEGSLHTIYTSIEDFTRTMDEVSNILGDPAQACIGWRPKNLVLIDDEDRLKNLLKLVDTLEESDDVQKVYGNYEVSDSLYEKLQTNK